MSSYFFMLSVMLKVMMAILRGPSSEVAVDRSWVY
jgi:hypothetical protein